MKGKNMLLLGREESPNRQPSIQEIIRDLKYEIGRGEAAYTSEELRLLERKLEDYEHMMRRILSGP